MTDTIFKEKQFDIVPIEFGAGTFVPIPNMHRKVINYEVIMMRPEFPDGGDYLISLLEQGWELYGEPFSVAYKGEDCVAQAMVKYKEIT